jgi:hypothetical protein
MRPALLTLLASFVFLSFHPLAAQVEGPPPAGHRFEIPRWLVGEWEGTGYQTNTSTEWLTLLLLEPGEEKPLVTYPSLSCQGEWQYRGDAGGRLHFQEIITENSGLCSNQDHIYITPRDEDQILVEYAHAFSPKRIIASAVMDRVLKP